MTKHIYKILKIVIHILNVAYVKKISHNVMKLINFMSKHIACFSDSYIEVVYRYAQLNYFDVTTNTAQCINFYISLCLSTSILARSNDKRDDSFKLYYVRKIIS